MEEPEYIIFHPKRDIKQPSHLDVKQVDAFYIQLSWQFDIMDIDSLDGFVGNRYVSTLPVDNILDLDFNEPFLIPLKDIDLDTIDQILVCTYLDSGGVFDAWNYYEVEAQYNGQESFATRAMSGVYMQIKAPDNIEIEQLNDYQLKLRWDSSKFATYYRLERMLIDGALDTVFFISDTSFIDSSFNLHGNLLENTLTVDGLQSNTNYTYRILASDSQDGSERIS